MKKIFLVSCLMVFCAFSTVFAGTLVKKVYFSTFPIIINGENYSSETPILNYQNRTYVALREFSQMVGVNIDFDDNTIIIDSKIEDVDEETKKDIQTIDREELLITSSEDKNVYISKTGTKYHVKSDCGGGIFSIVKLSIAKEKGYTSCLKCSSILV